MQSAWRALLEDIELMPQDQDFCFQPPSRLEAVAQHTDEEEANCDHQSQSCRDSLAAVPVGNSHSYILMVQPAQDGHGQRLTDGLHSARDRRVLIQ